MNPVYAIIIKACMSQSPNVCITEQLSADGPKDISGIGCMLVGPTLVNMWVEDHQKEWTLVDWKCTK